MRNDAHIAPAAQSTRMGTAQTMERAELSQWEEMLPPLRPLVDFRGIELVEKHIENLPGRHRINALGDAQRLRLGLTTRPIVDDALDLGRKLPPDGGKKLFVAALGNVAAEPADKSTRTGCHFDCSQVASLVAKSKKWRVYKKYCSRRKDRARSD